MQLILHSNQKALIQINTPSQTSISDGASMNMTPRTPFCDLTNGLYFIFTLFHFLTQCILFDFIVL